MPARLDRVIDYPDRHWQGDEAGSTTKATTGVEAVLESGRVLQFPHLAFELAPAERAFLEPGRFVSAAKNISVRWGATREFNELRGAVGETADLAALQAMIERYGDYAAALVERLFPAYVGHLRRGGTSFRPQEIEGRVTSWRQDDTRLHVDAFPSNPTRGARLLRVFTNIHPDDRPRRWRVGEPFADHAAHYLGTIGRPLPGSSWLLHRLKITKARRTEYDHTMLALHDRAKADAAYQRDAAQQAVAFAPGTTWVVYSDQVPHAAMSGQFMMEQTFMLDPQHQVDPQTSPLRTLERLLGRTLA